MATAISGRAALFKPADDTGMMWRGIYHGKPGTYASLHIHTAEEEARLKTFGVVKIYKPDAHKNNSLERIAIERMIEEGYYTRAQAEGIMQQDEGLTPGQSTYVGVREQTTHKNSRRFRWTGMLRLVSGQLPAPGGPGSSRPLKRPGVKMPWELLNDTTRAVAREHLKPDEGSFSWEFSRGFNTDPKTAVPILRAAALAAYRELGLWGGDLKKARVFIQTRRGVKEEPPKNPEKDDRCVRERLYSRWGFKRLGDHKPGPDGQVVLVASLEEVLNPKPKNEADDPKDLRDLDETIARFAVPGSDELDHSAYRTLDEAWSAKHRAHELYLDGSHEPLRLQLHDYTAAGGALLQKLYTKIDGPDHWGASRFFRRDQRRNSEYSSGDAGWLWRSKSYLGIEGLDNTLRAHDPVRALRASLIGIWLSYLERHRTHADAEALPYIGHLSFTSDLDAIKRLMRELDIEPASTRYEHVDKETLKYYYEIPPETLNRWVDEHRDWVEDSKQMIGSGYFDILDKYKAPFAL